MMNILITCFLLAAVDVIQFSKGKMTMCDGHANESHTVDENNKVTAEFCVPSEKTVDDVITINKRPVNLTEKDMPSDRYIITWNRTSKNTYCYTVLVKQLQVGSVQKYTVVVTANNTPVCEYRFYARFRKESLKLCPGEDVNKTVTAYSNHTAMFHLCLTSDHGIVDHIGIDGTVYVINGHDDPGPHRVRQVTLSANDRKKQFLQILVPHLNRSLCVSYRLVFSPSSYLRIEPEVLLQHERADDFPKPCKNRLNYRYFLAQVNETKVLKFCFANKSKLNNTPVIKHDNTKHHLSQHRINFSCENNLCEINITINRISHSDFERYQLKLLFDSNFEWKVTFYLLEEKEVPRDVCKDGNMGSIQPNHTATFCVNDYGVVIENDVILINDVEHVIQYGLNYSSGSKLSVSGNWNRKQRISYLKIGISQMNYYDYKSYNVFIPMVDKNYTFEFKLEGSSTKSKATTIETKTQSLPTMTNYELPISEIFLENRDIPSSVDLGVTIAFSSVGFLIIITIVTAGVAFCKKKGPIKTPPSSYPDSVQTPTGSLRDSDTPSSRHIYERISSIISGFVRSNSSGSSRSWSSVITDYRRKVVLSEIVYAEPSSPGVSSGDSFSQRVESDCSGSTLRNSYYEN